MTSIIMIAKGFLVCVVCLITMGTTIAGMVWLLFGRDALMGNRHYSQEVTMSIGAGGLIMVALFIVATMVIYPISVR